MANCFPSDFVEFSTDNLSSSGASVSIWQPNFKVAMSVDLFTNEGKLPIEGRIYYNSFKLATISCKPFALSKDTMDDDSKWIELKERKVFGEINNVCYEGIITDEDGGDYSGGAFAVNLSALNSDSSDVEVPQVETPTPTPTATPTPEISIPSTDVKNCVDVKPSHFDLFNLMENEIDDGEFGLRGGGEDREGRAFERG